MEKYDCEILQRLADILYDIYIKTYINRKISERNCDITVQLLQLSNDCDDKYIKSVSSKDNNKLVCKCIDLKTKSNESTSEINEREKKYVNDIDSALKKAQSTRLIYSRSKSTISPYLQSQKSTVKTKLTRSQTLLPSKGALKSQLKTKELKKNEIKNSTDNNKHEVLENILKSSEQLSVNTVETSVKPDSQNVVFTHFIYCPLNEKNKKSKYELRSQAVDEYPASLQDIRLPSEIQRALKHYYKFLDEKDLSPSEKTSKSKTLFLTKLNSQIDKQWESHRKNNYKLVFELNVYLNINKTHGKVENKSPLECKFYDDENLLLGYQNTVLTYDTVRIYKTIFDFLNNDLMDLLNLGNYDLKLLSLIFKCVMNIVNMYNSGKTMNVVVLKT